VRAPRMTRSCSPSGSPLIERHWVAYELMVFVADMLLDARTYVCRMKRQSNLVQHSTH
jgi:hypothetical protein